VGTFSFGPFRYDAEQRLLYRDEEVVLLAPKTIDTLQILLEHRGKILEKGELMKLVWPDTTVEEIGLARNISILRKALGEQPGGDSYIETVPRRGYRFVAPAPEAPITRTRRFPPRWALGAAALAFLAGLVYWQFYVPSQYVARGAGLVGLAVVPFESGAAGEEQSGPGREITDLLVTDLSKINKIQVVSPSTVRRHQRFGVSMGLMGRLLGLDVLVEGSVQTSGPRLLVTARLVDVHTGKVIWGENYDRPAVEGEKASIEVAQDVATQIAAHLAGLRN
jgi:DNA-binding winged helix-turn-helix (wHTH) protein/TolB-like protein